MASSLDTSRRGFLRAGGGLLIGFSLSDSGVLPELDGRGNIGQSGARAVWTPGCASRRTRASASSPARWTSGWACRPRSSQMVAEELDVAPGRVQLTDGRYGRDARPGRSGRQHVDIGRRQAAAQCRGDRAVPAAANGFRRNSARRPEQLQVKNGIVSAKGDASKSISYGALAGGHRTERGAARFGRRLRAERGRQGEAQGPGELHGRGPVGAAGRSCRRRFWGARPIPPTFAFPECCTAA